MNSSPAYSIVLPAFNAQATIQRAVDSVLVQSFDSWELVIVDDGSADRTAAIVSEYAARDARIRLITQANGGTAAARNAGISAARSAMVAFLDADDELMTDYLMTMDEFACSNPGYDIFHPNLVVRSRYGDALYSPDSEVRSFTLDDLLRSCVIPSGGALMKRDLLMRLAGFRVDLHCEDYDFALRAIGSGARALYLPVPLYVYHQEHQSQRSRDHFSGAADLERSLQDLIDSGIVEVSAIPSIERALRSARAQRANASEQTEMHAQVGRLQEQLERLVGGRAATAVLSLLYRVRWLLRPVRRRIARRRSSGR